MNRGMSERETERWREEKGHRERWRGGSGGIIMTK